jgi:hypothetical protein
MTMDGDPHEPRDDRLLASGALLLSPALAAAGAADGRGSASTPSFSSPLYGAPYGAMSFVANPLVSADYRATPDYNYLYTPASTYRSAPRLRSHRYAADHSYLLRPSPGSQAVASAYRWKYCTQVASSADPEAALRGKGLSSKADRASAGRGAGRKLDGALKPHLGGQQGPWRTTAALSNLRLVETVRLPSSPGSGTAVSCLLSH